MRFVSTVGSASALMLSGAIAVISASAQTASDAPYRANVESDGVQRIRIVGGSYFFKPNHIVVKARTPVELTLVKEPGIAPHNFVIQAPAADVAVEKELGTEPTKIAFTPTAPGKYEFYCSNKLFFMPSHRRQGMEGILEVVE
jgi:plastocyanin